MSNLPPTNLLVPREEAEEKIKAQMKMGSQILRSPLPPPMPPGFSARAPIPFEQSEAKREKWAKFTVHLLQTLFDNESIAEEFGDTWVHHPGYYLANDIERLEEWMKQRIVRLDSIVDRLPLFPLAVKPARAEPLPAPPKQPSKKIFIVHGHDKAARHEVARFIGQLDLDPIILHEQANQGRTLIEKVEHHGDVGFAVVLLTPDDMGHLKDKPDELKARPRQNVVLELGYFIGKLGRSRVCTLQTGDIEFPSDYAGVLNLPLDDAGGWKQTLAKEIKAAGIEFDPHKLL